LNQIKNVRKYFIIRNFFVFFLAFTVPTIIAGIFLLFGSFQSSRDEAIKRLEQTISLVQENLETLTSESKMANLYVEESNLITMSRMMKATYVDYADSLQIRQFSSFFNSLVNSRPYTDSIYLYLVDNQDRFYSSTKNFSALSMFEDKLWIDSLMNSKVKTWIERRKKIDYAFEKPNDVLTIFNRFSSFDGGTAINYSFSYIENLYSTMMYFQDQTIMVFDSSGQEMIQTSFSDSSISSEKFYEILINTDVNGIVEYSGKRYVLRRHKFEPFSLEIATFLPWSSVLKNSFIGALDSLIIIALIVFITMLLAYLIALKNYNDLNKVIRILESVDKKIKLPQLKANERDMYSKILHNIIKIFVEKDYLQVQLSEQKFKQKVAELQALQYQINPHFLYNTLQTINFEIMGISGGEQTKANQMIENLSSIVRYSLQGMESKVPFEKEIEFCKRYVDIQSQRYQSKFKVIWRIDEHVSSSYVPRLLIQPLIENSILHGIVNNKQITIKIQISIRNEIMNIIVGDNGAGIEGKKLSEIRNLLKYPEVDFNNPHIGLINCACRLKLEYNKESSIKIYSKSNSGTVVILSFRCNR
jgi:two-component system sensor histidine kinase YesM